MLCALVRLRPAASRGTGGRGARGPGIWARRGMLWRTSTCGCSAHSALTTTSRCPKGVRADDMAHGIPVTYVPARNTIFLSFALAWAEVLDAPRHLHRRERARLLRLSRLPSGIHRSLRAHGQSGDQGRRGRRTPIRIHTPLIRLSKAEIVRLGQRSRPGLRPDAQLLRSGCARARLAASAIPACCAARDSKRRALRIAEIFYSVQGEGIAGGRALACSCAPAAAICAARGATRRTRRGTRKATSGRVDGILAAGGRLPGTACRGHRRRADDRARDRGTDARACAHAACTSPSRRRARCSRRSPAT